MAIRAFLSHSHRNKKLADKVKRSLNNFGIEGFLAHTDINPSTKWEATIKKNLRDCELFIPLLTNAFKESDWTDQETGFAIALGKCVLPLRVDFNPYGFAAAHQALRLRPEHIESTCWKIVESLSSHKKFARPLRDSAFDVFLNSPTFHEAEERLPKFLRLAPFSRREMKAILERAARNQNIYGCYMAQTPLKKISREMGLENYPAAQKFEKVVRLWNKR